MADELQSTDSSESEKAEELERLNSALQEEHGAEASQNKVIAPIKSGGSMADAQQQRYMQRALNRSTQTNMSKFTANRLEPVVPSGISGDVADEVQKEEPSRENLGITRKVAKDSELAPSKSYLGTLVLVSGIVVSCCIFLFMQHKKDAHEDQSNQLRSPSSATKAAGGKSATAIGAFYLNRAELSMLAGNYRKALADLKTASIKDPGNKAVCLKKIGEILTTVGNNQGVIASSEALLSLEPTNVTALLQHAQASYRLGKKLSARNDLFRAIELEPKNAQSYAARGAYYSSEKDYPSAESDFKNALLFDPKNADVRQKLAALRVARAEVHPRSSPKKTVIHEVTNVEQSPLSISELKQLKSSDLDSLRQSGKQALNHHRFEFAVEALRRCVIINPNDPESRRLLAYSLIKVGDPSGAFDQFNAWNSIVVLGLNEQLAFGRALAKAGDSQTTIAFFNLLVDHHSTDAEALLSVAKMADVAGDCSEPVDRAVNLGLKRSTGNLRDQFLVLKKRLHI